MKNLQEATERIYELKGSLVALDALMPALLESLGPASRARLGKSHHHLPALPVMG